jgi:hypothetical protein
MTAGVLVRGDVPRAAVDARAGVADPGVEAPEALHRRTRDAVHRLLVGDVRHDVDDGAAGRADLRDEAAQVLLGPCGGDDLRAALGEHPRGSTADAARRAGDHDNLLADRTGHG